MVVGCLAPAATRCTPLTAPGWVWPCTTLTSPSMALPSPALSMHLRRSGLCTCPPRTQSSRRTMAGRDAERAMLVSCCTSSQSIPCRHMFLLSPGLQRASVYELLFVTTLLSMLYQNLLASVCACGYTCCSCRQQQVFDSTHLLRLSALDILLAAVFDVQLPDDLC